MAKGKITKPTDTEQVDEWMKKLAPDLKPAVEAVRKIIKTAAPELNERIKWNAPSYCVNGEDRLTFNLRGKDFFRLILHCGVKIKACTLRSIK